MAFLLYSFGSTINASFLFIAFKCAKARLLFGFSYIGALILSIKTKFPNSR
jgi:hypothetical protein